ncbi:MAG: methionyl-tRNA formyltransferase [Candidatus Delongbacteria bacterium]
MKDRSLIFMGTPEFSVCSLKALFRSGFNIKAVVTQPDKQRGRGKKVSFTPVKTAALELGLPVLQPAKMRDKKFIEELKRYEADLFVVVAFRILPGRILKIPSLGSINLHASLLPDYRGAAPVNHALFNGEEHTGVTVFFLNTGSVDTGDIVSSKKIPVQQDDNYGTLYKKLALSGAEILTKTVENIFLNDYTVREQEKYSRKIAPKIGPDDLIIDWNMKAKDIYNKIRGLAPKPGAYSILNNKRIKILSACYSNDRHSLKPGTVEKADRKNGIIKIAAGDGFVFLKSIQPESKPVISVKDFLNGNRIEKGSVLK